MISDPDAGPDQGCGLGWLVVEAEQDPAVFHPLTYAKMGYSNLSKLAKEAGW